MERGELFKSIEQYQPKEKELDAVFKPLMLLNKYIAAPGLPHSVESFMDWASLQILRPDADEDNQLADADR